MFQPADMSVWTGRDDTPDEGAAGRRWHQCVQALASDAREGVALLGFASDAGVARNHGRIGARQGPAKLRRMLAGLPAPSVPVFDAGDVVCEDDALETAQAEQAERLAAALGQGLLPITLGGGHEVALGSFRGLARHLAQRQPGQAPRVGIVNLDAHLDLRMAPRGSSGTPFRQIAEDCGENGWDFHYCCLGVSRFANTRALFDRARQLGVWWREDTDMGPGREAGTLRYLRDFLAQVDHVYFTICLDVLPAAVAPGVSAPAAYGVALPLIENLLDAIAQSGKLRLADIAELNPSYDIDDRTARTAARLVARLADPAMRLSDDATS